MIKDFTPARTSLSSGVVVKQHILERNRVRPAQVTSSNETLEGLIKPFSRGYDTGSGDTGQYEYISGSSIYRFKGGTGGTFDQFNGIQFYPTTVNNRFGVTQSWDEYFPSKLGTVVYDRDDQREFYNGEFSGSAPHIRIQRGLGNVEDDPCTPYLKINPNEFYVYQLEFFGGPDNDYTITSASLACCLPSITSIIDTGSNISVSFTLGSGTGSCLPVNNIQYQSSSDGGSTWSTAVTASTTSPLILPEPLVTTLYRIRSQCSGSDSSYSTPVSYTVASCCAPTLNSISEAGGNLTLTYTTGSGGSCLATIDVTLEYSGDLGSNWSIQIANTSSNPIVIPAPTGSATNQYRLISNCSGSSSVVSNVRNYIIPTSTLYINTDPVTLSGGIYSSAGAGLANIKNSPGITGIAAKSTYTGSWGGGSEQLAATIYVNNVTFTGNDLLYVVSGSNFNTSNSPYDWAVLQINNSGVVDAVFDSDGNAI